MHRILGRVSIQVNCSVNNTRSNYVFTVSVLLMMHRLQANRILGGLCRLNLLDIVLLTRVGGERRFFGIESLAKYRG